MPHVHLPDLKLAYEVAGDDGSPVLLIMGLTVPGRAWGLQVPALRARHRVAWFDNRGVGDSDAPPGPYTMDQMAADAEGLVAHLGWREAHVVGLSMGGMIAQHVALRRRFGVRSLTLIATHAGGGLRARLPHLAAARQLFDIARLQGQARLEAVARLLFPAEFLRTCDRDWLFDVLDRDFGTRVPERVALAQYLAIRGHSTEPRLHELASLPTLVVRPGRDILVRPEQADRLHRAIPGARLLRFDEAGHGVVRQCADPLNEALLQHFAAADERLGS